MTIETLKNEYEAANKAAHDFYEAAKATAKKENRVATKVELVSGVKATEPELNEAEWTKFYELKAIANNLFAEYEAAKKAATAEKRAANKAKKAAADLAKGITPEMRKAMQASARLEKQLAELEKQLEAVKAKKAYYDKIAKG